MLHGGGVSVVEVFGYPDVLIILDSGAHDISWLESLEGHGIIISLSGANVATGLVNRFQDRELGGLVLWVFLSSHPITSTGYIPLQGSVEWIAAQ